MGNSPKKNKNGGGSFWFPFKTKQKWVASKTRHTPFNLAHTLQLICMVFGRLVLLAPVHSKRQSLAKRVRRKDVAFRVPA